MNIVRVPGANRGRCQAVVNQGIVYAVAVDPTGSTGISEQTRQALKSLDQTLADAGSGKTGLLQATVYLKDIKTKAEMDKVWCNWIGAAENWPQRACVGAELAGNDLIEIVVTAVVLSGHE